MIMKKYTLYEPRRGWSQSNVSRLQKMAGCNRSLLSIYIGAGYLNYSGLTQKQMTHITQTLKTHIRTNPMHKEEVPGWWKIMIQSISGTMEFIFCPQEER